MRRARRFPLLEAGQNALLREAVRGTFRDIEALKVPLTASRCARTVTEFAVDRHIVCAV